MSDGKFSIPRESIPANWSICRVEDVGTVQLGRQRSPKDHNGPHMRPYLRAANVFEDRIDTSDVKEMNFTPEEFENFRLREGDILLNEGQSLELVGRPAMFRGEVADCCFQNTLVRFVPASVLDGRFALKLFQHYMRNGRFQKIARWTTNIAHLGASRFAELEIPLPPLAEQKRIVAKIEELFSELEAGEESLRVARRQLGVYRQSLLKQAFEGNLTAKWRTQNPAQLESPLWREVEVSEVLTSKPTNGRSVKDRAGGFRVLRLTAIKAGVIDTNENKEGDWDAADAAAHVIRKGNFLLSRGNGSIRLVGRGGIVREDADIAFPDTMIRLPLNLQLVDPLFFSYLWNSHQVRQQIEASARTTAGIYKINQGLLTRYRLPICSLPEQQGIVRLLDAQFEVIERNEREIDAALQRSEALRQAILKKAFTGRLVPQSPADEPASASLARLRVVP